MEIEDELVASGENADDLNMYDEKLDESQSTLAVSEDSTINSEDFTVYEDTNIIVKESEFIEIETALKTVEETFNDIEKNISEIEKDIEQSELEIHAMEIEMSEIEKTYIINDEIFVTKEETPENIIVFEENENARYFAANFISQQLSKCQDLIGVLYLNLRLGKALKRDLI